MPTSSSPAAMPVQPPAATPATMASPQVAGMGNKNKGGAAGAYSQTVGTSSTGVLTPPTTTKFGV